MGTMSSVLALVLLQALLGLTAAPQTTAEAGLPQLDFPLLPTSLATEPSTHAQVDDFGGPTSVLNVCIVSSEFAGIVPNGGIGTFYSTLAHALATEGHNVTLLFTRGRKSEHAKHGFDYWLKWYYQRGIHLVPLTWDRPPGVLWHTGTSFKVHEYLAAHAFDVVHYPDWQGHGYYALLAKRNGGALSNTVMCVMVHGPLHWARASNGEGLTALEDFELDFLEQQSIRLADILVSPSAYLLRWMVAQNWTLPPLENVHVQPYIMPHAARRALGTPAYPPLGGVEGECAVGSPARRRIFVDGGDACAGEALQEGSCRSSWSWGVEECGQPGLVKVKEAVFFGRLEYRKGVLLFCDALDRVAEAGGVEIWVTFLGSDRNDIEGINSREYLLKRTAGWPKAWNVTFITEVDSEGAVRYLQGEGRFAVLPSLAENSPLSILECLGARLPFLASTAGGIPEMISQADVPHVLFEPQVDSLKEALLRAFSHGVRIASPAVNVEINERQWVLWHTHAVKERGLGPAIDQTPLVNRTDPAISVCVTYKHSGRALAAALQSLLRQEGAHRFEALVMGPGGGGPSIERVRVPKIAVDTSDELRSESRESEEIGVEEIAAVLEDQALAQVVVERGLRWARWTFEEGASSSGARNKCFERTRGNLILFMDGQSYLEPNALRSFTRVLTQRPEVGVAASWANFYGGTLSGKRHPRDELPASHWRVHPFMGAALGVGAFCNCFGGPVLMVRRTTLMELGGFHTRVPDSYDIWEFQARAALAGVELELLAEPLVWSPTMPGTACWRRDGDPMAAAAIGPYLAGMPIEQRQAVVARVTGSTVGNYGMSRWGKKDMQKELDRKASGFYNQKT